LPPTMHCPRRPLAEHALPSAWRPRLPMPTQHRPIGPPGKTLPRSCAERCHMSSARSTSNWPEQSQHYHPSNACSTSLPSSQVRGSKHHHAPLPLPLMPARCRCQRPVDPLGDHRAACPRSGTLRARGMGLERAAARICREAGASVTGNILSGI